MIDILNKSELKSVLSKLSPDKQPVFGIMMPQHMVEHLAMVTEFSNGKRTSELQKSVETSMRWKQVLIYTDYEMQPGVKAPFIPDDALVDLRFADLNEAIDNLMDELNEFQKFFKENPEKEVIHPALGMMNFNEWVIFHNKHFTHHFGQFELL